MAQYTKETIRLGMRVPALSRIVKLNPTPENQRLLIEARMDFLRAKAEEHRMKADALEAEALALDNSNARQS